MSPSTCLVLLCGIPGAGKSTVAQALQKAAVEANGDEDSRTTVVNIELDTYIRGKKHSAEFNAEAWKVRRKALDEFILHHKICRYRPE